MSTRTIQFNGMHIVEILRNADGINIVFDHAIIVKNMDAAEQDTRWYGSGVISIKLLLEDIEIPQYPMILNGADIRDNQMIYRDEVAIPFSFHGHVGLSLRYSDSEQTVSIFGEQMSLSLSGNEKYIEHIKAE